MPRGSHFVPRSDIFNRASAGHWDSAWATRARAPSWQTGCALHHRQTNCLFLVLSARFNIQDQGWNRKGSGHSLNVYQRRLAEVEKRKSGGRARGNARTGMRNGIYSVCLPPPASPDVYGLWEVKRSRVWRKHTALSLWEWMTLILCYWSFHQVKVCILALWVICYRCFMTLTWTITWVLLPYYVWFCSVSYNARCIFDCYQGCILWAMHFAQGMFTIRVWLTVSLCRKTGVVDS